MARLIPAGTFAQEYRKNVTVEGATVLFGEPPVSMALVEGGKATTDGQGRYRADLGKFPWSTGVIQAFVLVPGYKAAQRKIEAGTRTTTANFELATEPWKETQIRMEDYSSKPFPGEKITCSVGGVIWSRLTTDARGCCRIAMPRYLAMRLSTEIKQGCPPNRGVPCRNERRPGLDHAAGPAGDPGLRARPRGLAGAQRGRWLASEFPCRRNGEMLPFFGGALAVTDRDSNFKIAPRLDLRFYMSRPAPRFEALCFADPSFRSMSYQLIEPNRPIRMAYQTFDPNRPVEPMKVTLKPSRRVRIPISREFVTSNRETQFDSQIWITPRKEIPDWRFFLITRDLRPKRGSATPADETVLEEYLPEGTYQFEVNLRDAKTSESLGKSRGEIVVPRSDGPLDLPPLALEPSDFQRMVGKPAPEIDATDLDTGRPVKLAEFRGKVVVLEFWGYWCGPCLGSMPHLMALKRKFAGRPLEILAVHDQSVQSRAVYDLKIAAARQQTWGGRDLPFRVLLDRPDPKKPADLNPEGTGTTVARYGITGFLTLFVIDRDGTMIRRVDHSQHDRLESLVRELLEKAEGVP